MCAESPQGGSLEKLRHPERRTKSAVEPVGRGAAAGSAEKGQMPPEIPPSATVLLRSSTPLRCAQDDPAGYSLSLAYARQPQFAVPKAVCSYSLARL